MKKLFFILLLCPLMILTSCKDNSKVNVGADAKELLLDQEIEKTKDIFPMQIDNATTLVSMKRDGDIVSYEYVFDENERAFDGQEAFKKQLRDNLVFVSQSATELYAFMTLLRDTGKTLRYDYKGMQTGKSIVIDFTNEDLHEIFPE